VLVELKGKCSLIHFVYSSNLLHSEIIYSFVLVHVRVLVSIEGLVSGRGFPAIFVSKCVFFDKF